MESCAEIANVLDTGEKFSKEQKRSFRETLSMTNIWSAGQMLEVLELVSTGRWRPARQIQLDRFVGWTDTVLVACGLVCAYCGKQKMGHAAGQDLGRTRGS